MGELTREQRNCLITCARFIDAAAGEGVGFKVEFEDGTEGQAWADDIAIAVAEAFNLELGEEKDALGAAVIRLLQSEGSQHG